MIDLIVQFLLDLLQGLSQSIGFRNFIIWSHQSSASSRERWPAERQPLRQGQQQQQEEV